MALSVARVSQLKELEQELGIKFKDLSLLNKALAHKSFVKENRNNLLEDNERLEFLGDAILKLVVSEYLYTSLPAEDEGFLTKVRASVVSDATLAEIALGKNLGRYLLLSKNEIQNGGVTRKSNLANAVEALFGASFLDSGLDHARDLILSFLGPIIAKYSQVDSLKDYKSQLQESVQALGWKLPEYRVIQESGPEHDKIFQIQVKVGKGLKKFKEQGSGHTKKEAEQNAAANVLKVLAMQKAKEI